MGDPATDGEGAAAPKAVSNVERGKRFEDRVAQLMGLLGFRVERDALVNGRQVDILATSVRGPFSVRYLVECKDKADRISVREFDSFLGRVESVRRQGDPGMEGIFVTTTGFVKEVRAQASALGVQLILIGELERSLLDVSSIVAGQLAELRQDRGVANFVEAHLRPDGKSQGEPAVATLREWLQDPDKNQLTLLGDFGTGKTTLLRQLTVALAEEFLSDQTPAGDARAPIYVDLRNFSQVVSIRQIVFDLFDRYRAELPSYDAFSQFFEEGRLVLLLDGFDELASKSDPSLTLENFREINRAALGDAKLILSCRTHYFVDDDHVYDFHREGDRGGSRAYSELYHDIAGRPNFEIRHVEDFGSREITDLIRNRMGPGAEAEVWAVLHERYNLADLAKRPVLLDMILGSFGRIQDESDEFTSAVLYQVYTNIWLERNDWNASITPETRNVLIEEFAARATFEHQAELHYGEIPEVIRGVQPGADSEGVEQWDRELRRAGFLIRNGSGAYRFAHRSFHEFFLAKYLVRHIKSAVPGEGGEGRVLFPRLYGALSSEVFRFTCDLMRRDETAVAQGVQLLEDRSIEEVQLGLLIKFMSRSKFPAVTAAMEKLIVDLRAESEGPTRGEEWGSRHAFTLGYAVTALGWLDRTQAPEPFVELLEDAGGSRLVRHNALIALLRSEHPKAIVAVCSFISYHPQRSIAQLFSSRIVLKAILARPGAEVERALTDRCTRDPAFAEEWYSDAKSARVLSELVQRGQSEAARTIRRRVVARAQSPRVVAFAAAGLRDDELPGLADEILYAGRKSRYTQRESAMAELIVRLGTPEALEALAALVVGGSEETSRIALRALCARAPGRVRLIVYGELEPWRGRHWSVPRRLETARMLQAEFPEDVAKDLICMLEAKRLPDDDAVEALNLLEAIRPEEMLSVAERLLSTERSASLVARSLECLYRIAPEAARALVLKSGIDAHPRPHRMEIARLLRSDRNREVTAVLCREALQERDRDVRAALARSIVAPGRQVSESQLRELIAQESDEEIGEILKGTHIHPA